MAFHTSNVVGQGIVGSDALSADPANAFGNAGAVRELWRKGVEVYEQTTDFFAPLEGGNDAILQTVTDTTKGRGQKITFTTMAGLYNEPKHGDELFDDGDAFESIKINSATLSVDFMRHGVRFTERAEEFMGMRGEIAVGIPRELGKWMGRNKSEKLFMSFLHHGGAANHIIANSKADSDALFSADTLDWDGIVSSNTQLSRLGGSPAKMGRDKNGNSINRYCTVATTDALFSLEQDGDYKDAHEQAGPDAYSNLLFAGGYSDVRGNIIKKYNPIDHDGYGAIASPLNPKAELGCSTTDGFTNNTTTGVAALRIAGGGSETAGALTAPSYFKYFPLFAFKFLATDTLLASSSLYGAGAFVVAVVNHSNAATDPNKIGYYQVTASTGNTGNLLVIDDKHESGDANNHFHSIPAFDATIHTNTHVAGTASIYLVNQHGVPYGHTLLMGKQAARRAYGKYRNQRSEDSHEGGFVKDIFVTSVFGQEPVQDAAGRRPGYLILTHALQYAGVPFPTVTS